MMEKLTLDELKELMRLFYNKGVSVGIKMKPINEIPMGSFVSRPADEFDKFFNETINPNNQTR